MDQEQSINHRRPNDGDDQIAHNSSYARLETGIEKGFTQLMSQTSQVMERLERLPADTAGALSQHYSFTHTTGRGSLGNHVLESESEAITRSSFARIEELESKLVEANRHMESFKNTEYELSLQLAEARRENAHLQKKEIQFREIILKSAGNQKITDKDVVDAFSDLRQHVQRLASTHIFDTSSWPVSLTLSTQAMRNFYAHWKPERGLNATDRVRRLKSRIYLILDKHVLSQPHFGLKEEQQRTEWQKEHWDIDEYLGKLEGILLNDPRVQRDVVDDWRIQTLNCIDLLKLPGIFSVYVAGLMFDFFRPIIYKAATKKEQDELWDYMLDVCERAFKFKMMMQRSKEGYRCHVLDLKEYSSYSEIEDFAECYAVEGGKSADASDEIAYFLFGGLTKYADNIGEKRETLEKAEVVLKRTK